MDRARVLLDINNAIVAHLDLKWSACGLGVRPSCTSETRKYECYLRESSGISRP